MKVLGLDIGTNSIGWGIVDETQKEITKCGVYIFPEGIKKEKKGNESSKAAERTAYRLARRRNFRRKLRKYETLKVLIANNMCPLTLEELEDWRTSKAYPTSEDFSKWYRTDETKNWEPYYLRKKCVETKAEPYEIGRALYHITQRRGFLSNRKETTKETEGTVKNQITEIDSLKGDKTLGQYFYELKKSGIRVRGTYTSRKSHYEAEFNRICEVQEFSDELKNSLYNAIFFQRKLKSQKFLVGRCTLEPKKTRCPISRPEFEEFRMLSFINSIKVSRNYTEDEETPFFPLTDKEKDLIKPLFFRVSKSTFDFKEISKKIAGKKEYWKFNYRNDASVSGCPVSASFQNVFGESWKNLQIGNYNIDDIWHVLFDFDDDEKLKQFALNKLSLTEEQIKKFCAIHFQQGYANLSLKAINKILPFLRKGYIYSHAVFLANIPTMISPELFEKNAADIEKSVIEIINSLKERNTRITLSNRCIEAIFKDIHHNFHSEEWNKSIVDEIINDLYGKSKWLEKTTAEQNSIKDEACRRIEDALKIAVTKNPNDYKYSLLRTDDLIYEYLEKQGYSIKKHTVLYHPSDIEYQFENPIKENDKTYLGSPRTPSVKNPVAMRALFQLRKLINYLIRTGDIDSTTRINVELAAEVNDKNWRKAISDFNRDNEKKNAQYREQISMLCKEQGFSIVPTDSDVRKYRLWIEQKETCPYTNKHISITALFGENPSFDFEHTIPRSLSYDDSLENLTLCDSTYNRNVKKQQIPSELPDFDEINMRFQHFYEEAIDSCLKRIEKNRTKGGYTDPAVKDARIVERHKAQLECNYYKGKLKRFSAKQVTSGFKHSQLNDTRIITRFALSYLKSVFNYVQPVNGSMTDLFKKQWGLLEKDEKKDRSNYRHHIVDALTIACINRGKYNLLCECIKKSPDGTHLKFNKPWETFDVDVTSAVQYVIPKHFVDDNSLRQTKKLITKKDGKSYYEQGSTARGSLHKDTVYGCIMMPPDKTGKNNKVFVQRIPCSDLTEELGLSIIDKGIQKAFFDNLNNGIQTIQDIQRNGILLPWKIEGKIVYSKKIRIKAGVSNPISLKQHDDASLSRKEHKQNYYVQNEENYLITLYKGNNQKGKELRSFLVRNLLDSVICKKNGKYLYPIEIYENKDVLKLYGTIKIGQIIILKNNDSEDVFSIPGNELWKRIYSVVGIESDGRIKLTHVSIAEPFSKSLAKTIPLDQYSSFRRITVNKIFALFENKDFIITPAGELKKLNNTSI